MQRLNDIEAHLIGDSKPSQFFETWTLGKTYPFNLVDRLKRVPQSQKHHPEGCVWKHTMLVIDEAAGMKAKASDERVFMWAALLHDTGKYDTTQIRRGKITSYGHDKSGALIAREFLHALNADDTLIQEVSALVRWHMQFLFVTASMSFADVDTMKRETDLNDVALLGLCDRLGRGRANRREEENNMREFLRTTKQSV